jgi:hypothetical protein
LCDRAVDLEGEEVANDLSQGPPARSGLETHRRSRIDEVQLRILEQHPADDFSVPQSILHRQIDALAAKGTGTLPVRLSRTSSIV